MLTIIKERTSEINKEYRIEFTDANGAGFTFPCDVQGNLEPLTPEATLNYQEALAHPEKFVVYNELTEYDYPSSSPAIGKCKCGFELPLESQFLGATQCECGRWYNMFGQELKDPKYWEEDF